MTEQLDTTGQKAIEYLGLKHAARERALPRSRTAIRFCANSIRATHRQEFQHAGELLAQAAVLLAEMAEDLRDHQDIFYAGFVQDAQKELAEAAAFLALAQNLPLPEAQTLSIGWAPYLNGLGETVGELRRYVLDQLRRGNIDQCEVFLRHMDDIYALLTLVDFPDAITLGLRRTTDTARSILENRDFNALWREYRKTDTSKSFGRGIDNLHYVKKLIKKGVLVSIHSTLIAFHRTRTIIRRSRRKAVYEILVTMHKFTARLRRTGRRARYELLVLTHRLGLRGSNSRNTP